MAPKLAKLVLRRAICGLTPKNLNKTFARLTATLLREGATLETFCNALAGLRGDTVKFPNDGELRDAIRAAPIYELIRRKDRLADMLWDLECASRSKYNVNTTRPADMSVEQLMPRAWRENWSLPDGRRAPAQGAGLDDAMNSRVRGPDAVLHTLGNLTLITVPANSTVSNKAFADKRPWLRESLLALNLAITEHEMWDEATIAARADVLADLAATTWKGLSH